MLDAMFLHAHPSWSPADLADADQDIIDLLSAFDMEGAKIAKREQMKANAAAKRRST